MSHDYVQANTNGRLHPAHEPSLSPLNRGFLYGDAVYEVWRSYEGVLFAWWEHWERLRQSARALRLQLPFTPDRLLREVRRTVREFARHGSGGEVYVRLQVTRGGGPIGLDPALADEPDFVLLVQHNREFPARKVRAGLQLSVARELRRNDRQTLDPAWKTGNYLNNLLCLREARARGADEVVMANLKDEITEAAVSNVHFVRRGVLLTPARESGLLHGITRGLLIERIAPAVGIAVRERRLKLSDLAAMDECFLSSTTKGFTPVAAIDARRFRIGSDTVVTKLRAAFAEYTHRYARTHPKLKVL